MSPETFTARLSDIITNPSLRERFHERIDTLAFMAAGSVPKNEASKERIIRFYITYGYDIMTDQEFNISLNNSSDNWNVFHTTGF